MKAYSTDLRQRVVAAYDAREGTQEQVAARRAASASSRQRPIEEALGDQPVLVDGPGTPGPREQIVEVSGHQTEGSTFPRIVEVPSHCRGNPAARRG
jgi:hypothetical protein